MVIATSKFGVTHVTPRIVHLNYKHRASLTSSFLRFQEFFESPRFKGKVFRLKEFKEWYSQENGGFTYYYDWDGFNIPVSALEPFYKGDFNPLSDNEKELLEAVRSHRGRTACVIGTFGEFPDALQHEIAHGLWATNALYKKRATQAIRLINKENRTELDSFLKESGYHPDVYDDEVHAYTLANLYYMKEVGITGPDMSEASKQLNYLYNLYLYIEQRKGTC